jgi:cyclic pyranopterin monophosphate synthase
MMANSNTATTSEVDSAAQRAGEGLSHIAADGAPRMVDVSAKAETLRRARAGAAVRFPPEVAAQLLRAGYLGRKGSVLHTAIIAGVQAAKRTHELLPFCHALALTQCDVRITPDSAGQLTIECEVGCFARTGVEMEALTGASAAALCVYDMCKALSHEIEIGPIRLLEKSGGKSNFMSERVP